VYIVLRYHNFISLADDFLLWHNCNQEQQYLTDASASRRYNYIFEHSEAKRSWMSVLEDTIVGYYYFGKNIIHEQADVKRKQEAIRTSTSSNWRNSEMLFSDVGAINGSEASSMIMGNRNRLNFKNSSEINVMERLPIGWIHTILLGTIHSAAFRGDLNQLRKIFY